MEGGAEFDDDIEWSCPRASERRRFARFRGDGASWG